MVKVGVEGKVALVTGANRGIGKAITIELLESGAQKVYACARDVGSLDDLKEKYSDKLEAVELDVTNEAQVEKVAENCSDVEILINNAGVLVPGNFSSGNILDSMESQMNVNVYGVVRLTNALFNSIKSSDSGAIVTVSSVAGLANMNMALMYSASKAAVHSVIQGVRAELKDSNVLVSGVYPGPIETDMTKDFQIEKASTEHVAKEVIKGIENGDEDIFPDPMSKQMGEVYMQSPKQLEKQFGGM